MNCKHLNSLYIKKKIKQNKTKRYCRMRIYLYFCFINVWYSSQDFIWYLVALLNNVESSSKRALHINDSSKISW